MIGGIPNRPLYFYQKDIIGATTSARGTAAATTTDSCRG